MARARNVKPGLFRNEILGQADPLFTLMFQGLWILADREGRLEDRPLRIKADVFPYRDVDAERMLNWLQDNGFIRRYSVAGKRYILILEFVKHQNPHKNESESVIPPPEEIGRTSEEIGSTRADSLSTDSLSSDSLIPDPLHSVPNGTGGKPPKLTDPKEIIFGYGLAMLVNASMPEKSARSFLGGRIKDYDEATVVNTLRECAKAKPLDPLAWLAAALPPPALASPKPNAQEALEASNRAIATRFLENRHAAQ